MAVEQFLQTFASLLLLSFDGEDDVDRQGSLGLESGLDGVDVHQDLALVVSGAAAEDLAVANLGFEGSARPLVEGIGGHDIVMAVEENRRQIVGNVLPGPYDGVVVIDDELTDLVHPGALEPSLEPSAASVMASGWGRPGLMLGIRTSSIISAKARSRLARSVSMTCFMIILRFGPLIGRRV